MGKKKREVLEAEKEGFSEGMRANGYSQRAVDTLWEILVPFSDYAFNKSHTAGYGLVSYWTAYLKANYPAQYMAALLSSVKDDKDKMALYLNECRRMQIQVLPPDVNESQATFTPVNGDIRFGLTAVRNVGANVVSEIGKARAEPGRFTDFNDFMEKVSALVCNKRVIESLIKAGAFDEMKHKRRALVAIHETAVDQYVDIKRNEAIGQDSLFGGLDDEVGRRVRHLGERPRHRRVGQDDAARPRARDARALRLRPSADGPRARPRAGHRRDDRPAADRRGARRRLAGDRRRAGDLGAAQDQQARRHLGDRDAGGPRRRHRRPLLRLVLPAGQHLPHRGRDPHRQGELQARGRPGLADRAERLGAEPGRGPVRAGRHQPGGDPLHPAGRRPAEGHPGHPPGHRPRCGSTCAPARAPRSWACPTGGSRRARRCSPTSSSCSGRGAWRGDRGPPASGAPLGGAAVLLVLLAFAVGGVVAGFVWHALWTPPTGLYLDETWHVDSEGAPRDVAGTGLYVVVAAGAGIVLGFAVALLTRGHEIVTLAAVAVGSALAGLLMAVTGHALGPDDPRPQAAGQTRLHRRGRRPPGRGPISPYIAFPAGALTALAASFLLLGASPRSSPSSRTEAEPAG